MWRSPQNDRLFPEKEKYGSATGIATLMPSCPGSTSCWNLWQSRAISAIHLGDSIAGHAAATCARGGPISAIYLGDGDLRAWCPDDVKIDAPLPYGFALIVVIASSNSSTSITQSTGPNTSCRSGDTGGCGRMRQNVRA